RAARFWRWCLVEWIGACWMQPSSRLRPTLPSQCPGDHPYSAGPQQNKRGRLGHDGQNKIVARDAKRCGQSVDRTAGNRSQVAAVRLESNQIVVARLEVCRRAKAEVRELLVVEGQLARANHVARRWRIESI